MSNNELELEAELEELMGLLTKSDLESELEWEGEAFSGAPANRCAAAGTRVAFFGCSDADRNEVENLLAMSIPVATLRSVVETSAGGAVFLATAAATALDKPNRTNSIRATFCEAFGVMPEFVPPWRAGLKGVVRWSDLGELVAIRLRDVAKILDGGCIHYFCWVTPANCPDCTGGDHAKHIFACSDFHGRYVICLGGLFWQAWQAGDTVTTDSTLLHESLHIYFRTTVADRGRSGNANCYERFAVRLQNLFLHPATDSNCAAGVCALPPPPSKILDQFGFDKATVPTIHLPMVGQIAADVVSSWKTPYPIRSILLTGYADSRGTDAYNLALGRRRALSTRDEVSAAIKAMNPALLSNLSFIIQSEGARKPIAPSTTTQGRARNRRVEISLRQA